MTRRIHYVCEFGFNLVTNQFNTHGRDNKIYEVLNFFTSFRISIERAETKMSTFPNRTSGFHTEKFFVGNNADINSLKHNDNCLLV